MCVQLSPLCTPSFVALAGCIGPRALRFGFVGFVRNCAERCSMFGNNARISFARFGFVGVCGIAGSAAESANFDQNSQICSPRNQLVIA